MKCIVAIFLLVVIAVVMAEEKQPEVENLKNSPPPSADIARDKRGLAFYSSYAYAPYAPYAYSGYNLPYAYTPYSLRYQYPYYYY